VVLAPTINLMRTPLGGRGFECFSEDPLLSARIAAGYVAGLQSAGVGAAVKHYVGNDSETERGTYDARIADAALRELYLLPFQPCLRAAGALVVMAAYNSVNGALMTEHEPAGPGAEGRMGFSGVVVSDWSAARSTVPTAQLPRPGHARPEGALGSRPGRGRSAAAPWPRR
jgi:beta-glucosidase